jgi:hypothetical protein
VEVFTSLGDVENWIGDELPWAVERHIASSIGGANFDSLLCIPLGGVKQIFGVETGSQGEDGGMLDKE